ncbi:hypothetical protein [Deinococcus ruber]|uniref:Uncharacterized protein n=1 Tax=Deinococcus ruber TaxID=1848197 RepID=A0A918F737_9DEIO|nr:hypothetical protein [Deinococcus ruber]GGR11562.1 hypothetical protein GCM10008957_25650 [Deinococcus ruber]
MTDTQARFQDELSPEVLTLAQLLAVNPKSAKALRDSIERQQAQRGETRARLFEASCPHCAAPGILYLTLATGEFRRRRKDCCQPALRDAAEAALHNALAPFGTPEDQVEASIAYMTYRSQLTDPELIRELDTHERLMTTIDTRLTKTAY